jgi:chemotaxis protein CheD
MIKIVGIGEFIISNNMNDIIKTHALSSCVAVTLYSPTRKIAAMIHIALPYYNTEIQFEYENVNKFYYANLGIPLLISKMCNDYGCFQNEFIVNMYGGARSIRDYDYFNIGERNIEAVKDVLDRFNFRYNDDHIGGKISRTLEMAVDTGEIKIITQPLKI